MAPKRRNVKEFHGEHGRCWMCEFLRKATIGPVELHHIAGRGRKHDVRANYAALCQKHHQAIQGMKCSELVCLVLKMQYDPEHYDPALICYLRGWAASAIEPGDVYRCERIMSIMREVL